MIDTKHGSGHLVQIINLEGHPLHGNEAFSGTISYEVISAVPLFPQEIFSGKFQFEGSSSSEWIEQSSILPDGQFDSNPNDHFKYQLPTDKNWSFEWVDKDYSASGEPVTSLYLQSAQANADVCFYFLSNRAGFEFDWEPIPLLSSGYDLFDPLIVSSASYNSSLNSGVRIHYESNGRKLKAEFDENLTGNWVLFFEGSLDAGVDSWTYHNPSSGVQTTFLDTQYETLPNIPPMDV